MGFFFLHHHHLLLLLYLLTCCPLLSSSGRLSTYVIYPNFTASYFQFIDQFGDFLLSPNATFKASISNLKSRTSSQFYFCVIHVPSSTIVWTANRERPFSDSDKLSLTIHGLAITINSTDVIWSAPKPLNSTSAVVSVLQLRDSGNLVLLDKNNVSIWESFDHPTDTIVMGQLLVLGKSLDSSVQENDLSVGSYRLMVSESDAVLLWKGMTFWKLSMNSRAYQDSTAPVSSLAVNATGLYLLAKDGSTVVFRVVLDRSEFRLAKLESNGKFVIRSFVNGDWVQEFAGPDQDCEIPFICGEIGLCTTGSCSCPPSFHSDPRRYGSCTPSDTSLSLPSNACSGSTEPSSSVFFVKLDYRVDYFAISFSAPVKSGVNLSVCQEVCSKNCSCLGIFLASSSGSCYLLENYLGSFMLDSAKSTDRLGYIKTIVVSSPRDSIKQDQNFPIAVLVLLPSSGFFLLVVLAALGVVYGRRNGLFRAALFKLGHSYSSSSDLEIISIPGIPLRFTYEELEVATENFRTRVGSGGFGAVYRGTLPDKTMVAVKKINSIGLQGKKEFCTEIAIIGKIHHINLVNLRGFCAQRKQWFLVLEYMNRGSLDRALFGDGPTLEWSERFQIALGTARGLAYLHSGCEHKIIHCDVKPENILLHDNFQVKISDFGLSKLLSPEQSSLFTTLRGTRGYLAPEWLTGSTISDKADVYSYGMVLLEIVRGRKNSSPKTQSSGGANDNSAGNGLSSSSSGSDSRPVYYPLLALEMHVNRRYLELADTKLVGRVTNEEVEKLVRVALCCLHEDPILRPTMANVVAMLEGTIPLTELRLESLNFLRLCGRRFAEASTAEGFDEGNELVLFSNGNQTCRSATSCSHDFLSHISADQVSGPR